MARSTLRATLLVVVSACCFGTVSPLTVLALKSGASLPGIQTWRYATTAVLLIVWALWLRRARTDTAMHATAADAINTASNTSSNAPRSAPQAPWYSWRLLLVAGGGQALVATLALSALEFIPAATEAFLFYTFPAWVAVLTAIRGIERLDRLRVTALILALAGIACMVGAPSTGALNPIGVAIALTAALVYAIYIPVLNTLQQTRPALDVARAIATGGTVVFLVWATLTGTLFAHFTLTTYLVSMLQGVLSAGAFLGFLAGLETLGPVRTAITSTVEPFWTTMLGVALLAQPIGNGTLLGGAAIMGAVLLLQRPVRPSALHSS
jgi:drug/metabolite transporter (DMT)-like permease